jgi:hypothetical protein
VSAGVRRSASYAPAVAVEDELRAIWRRNGCTCTPSIMWRGAVVHAQHGGRCPLVRILEEDRQARAPDYEGNGLVPAGRRSGFLSRFQ